MTAKQPEIPDTPTRPTRMRLLVGVTIALSGFALSAGAGALSAAREPGTAVSTEKLARYVRGERVSAASASRDAVTVTVRGERYTAHVAPVALESLAKQLNGQGVILGTTKPATFGTLLAGPATPLGPPLWTLPAFAGLALGALFAFAPSLASARSDEAARQKRALVGTVGAKAGEGLPDRFSDLVGCDEVVEQVAELVEYLRDPEPYERLGATMPRGLLLVGQPGTGKTKLARAVAAEADAEYFFASGADFVEVFVGVGSSRIRDLFQRARACERAVIFIDEIDAIGRARSGSDFGVGAREYDNTLNSLLVEMDGFARTDHVIVLAATNRPELLDAALLRPGRLDRKVIVPAPDAGGRTELLGRLLSDKPTADDIDIPGLGRKTIGMTGADLVGVVNEAAIAAARAGRDAIGTEDLAEAVRVVHIGRERPGATRPAGDVEIIAWHEAGHAVCAHLTPGAQEPEEVSIVARGLAGGVTWMLPREEMLSASAARADLCTLLGGRAAEELLLHGDYTTGAQGDLRSATDLAERMVFELGMNGTLAVHDRSGLRLPDSKLDVAVEELIQVGLDEARTLLGEHRDALAAVAERLLEVERIDAAELIALIDAHRPIPAA